VHEYKTINSAGFAKLTRPQTKHVEQATTYAACLDAPLTVYFYLNKDDSNLQDFVIPFEPKVWEATIKKIEVVQAWVAAGVIPPWEHTSAILSPRECQECGYRRICQPPAQQMPNIRR
jgi:CRISPR/Cas system-associated exonuclease Cas4 (RecB family)